MNTDRGSGRTASATPDSTEAGNPVLAIGLLSGTSADGIDAAAVEFPSDPRSPTLPFSHSPIPRLRAFLTHPYPPEIREALFRCFDDRATVRQVCLLHAALGEVFADAAEAVLARVADPPRLAFVASHGQTVWHEPPPACHRTACNPAIEIAATESTKSACADWTARTPDAEHRTPNTGNPTPNAQRPTPNAGTGTLQLGEAARIAERLQVPVVCDFRQQDLALGGQGAPLVPYLDYLLFSDPAENRAVQNLGGIGNVTYLRAGGSLDEVVAFDTGPANALIDAAAGLLSAGELSCDRDGLLAASAPVDEALLRELMTEPYLQVPPPKSTGRELFSAARVRALWDRGHQGPVLVSTLTQYTVETIALAYRSWLGPVDAVVLGGGGARNPELVRRLAAALAPARLLGSEDFGLDGDAKEAVLFAVLGYETLAGRPSNVPCATGATRPAVQGKVCLP